jgi:hypothetical protein
VAGHRELAVRKAESISMVEAASLDVYPSAAQTMQVAGGRDSRLSADGVTSAARQAVTAWALAVDGDETTLAALAQPHAANQLMHPVRQHWQVAPGPTVTRIAVLSLDADAQPPQLGVHFEFAGRRRFEVPDQAEDTDGTTQFVGLLQLTLQDSGRWPWQLSSGQVETLDDYLGYVFTSRRESPDEYRERAGAAAAPAPARPGRAFRLIAGFAEHDERFGATASIEVRRETAPTRAEAEELVWPAVLAETRKALGDGDWLPSLNWLDVVELLDQPPVDVAPTD